ncbi:MAG TPA: hypothetical protein PK263_06850, partial [bacterium]|nr:hypothetical protein [bacterium]
MRTRPLDKEKVLLTKDDIAIVEEEWSILNGTHDQYLAGKHERESVRNELTKNYGSPPSEDDVDWVLLNRQLSKEASSDEWGAYTSTRLKMAEALRKRNKPDHALRTYLEVAYLNLNGPRNFVYYSDKNKGRDTRFVP